MNIEDVLKLAASILIAQAAGFIGSVFTSLSVSTWYAGLAKPALAPPGSVISVVWITLFTLMGISSYLVGRKGLSRPGVRPALMVYGVQLILNMLWSAAFFGLRSPAAGLAVIAALWVSIIETIRRFHRVSPLSAALLVPLIIWVSFAAYLNYSVWHLNR